MEQPVRQTLEGFLREGNDPTLPKEYEHPLQQMSRENIHWDGKTVWEYSHPTFVSPSRKTFLTIARKAGHSSCRKALALSNKEHGDDWHWMEGPNREPSRWLSSDDYWTLIDEVHQENPDEKKFAKKLRTWTKDILPSHITFDPARGDSWIDEKTAKFLGPCFAWRIEQDNGLPDQFGHNCSYTIPLVCTDFFKDWKKVMVIREPWDRFVSGLITELDMGFYTPWFTNHQHRSKKLWEESYLRMKRLLLWSEPEHLLFGNSEGPQTDHTFPLSNWTWNGKSIFDVYDEFIPCDHELEMVLRGQEVENWGADEDSIKKGSSMIRKLQLCGLLSKEIDDGSSGDRSHDQWQHTNVTPPNRRMMMDELIQDPDMEEWFKRCREIVQNDIDAIEINKSKFV